MSDHRDVRVFKCSCDPVCDLLTRLILTVVDTGDHEIGFRERFVIQIHFARFQDVTFDSFEDDETVLGSFIDRVNLFPLSEGFFVL